MPLSIFVRHIPKRRYVGQGERDPGHEVTVTGESEGGGEGHTHANKTLLDTYNQSNPDVADAISKKHSNSLDHSNALDHSNSLDHANANDPSVGEKAALVGTSGTPGSGNKFVTDNDSRNTNSRAPTNHSHAPSEVTGTAVVTNDSRLSDARTPLAHNQAISTITNLQTTLDGKAASSHGHAIADTTGLQTALDGKAPTSHSQAISTVTGLQTALDGKEPANANIQAHVISAHAPSNAQKNSDIIKSEIEAKLTGEISTHTHAGGGGGLGLAINIQALTSSPTDSQTVYFGMLPKAPTTTANISKIYTPAGTIKRIVIYCYSGTAGTAEAWSLYVRKNNTTDTLIATLSMSTNERRFENTSISIAMNGTTDYIEIKGIQPLWATNPLTTIYGGYIYME